MEPSTPTPPVTPPTQTPPPTEPAKKRHEHRYGGFNPWRVFMGLFIVLIGLAFLAQQFGWTWIHIEDVWKIWPVFIILVGLSMLTKGHVLNTVLSIILGVAIIAVGVAFVINSSLHHRETTTKTISIATDTGVTAAKVRLDIGASKVVLSGGSTGVVDGTFTSDVTTLSTDTITSDGVQTATLKMDQPGSWWGGTKNQLDGRLTSALPLTLDVNSGASDLNLDLTTVKATSISVDSGAASVNVRMGDLVDTASLSISAGASSIVITVPKSVGVNVGLDAAVSGKTLPDFTKVSDNHYESPDFAAATKKINISIHAGASSITVNRI